MILATFQPKGYNEQKKTCCSELKKVLDIPEDKNIYWCLPANSLEQLLAYVHVTDFESPDLFILFETDEYYSIDGVKDSYYRAIYNGTYRGHLSCLDDILNVQFPEYTKYIVTDIPEKKFEVDVPVTTAVDKLNKNGYRDDICKALSYVFPAIGQIYMDSDTKNCVETLKTASDGNNDDSQMHYTILKLFYMHAFYLAGMAVLGYASKKMWDLKVPSEVDAVTKILSKTHTHSYRSIDDTYSEFKEGMRYIYDTYFSGIEDKVYPNEACPCGSGLKYKRCCGIADNRVRNCLTATKIWHNFDAINKF